MPNTSLTKPRILEEVMSRLGVNEIDVELKQLDVDLATKEAVRLYARTVPRVTPRKLIATKAQKRYVLDPSQHPGLLGVLDVQFVDRNTTDSGQIDVFDPLNSGVTNLGPLGETYGEIVQRLVYTEDARRVMSSEPDWNTVWEGSVFALYVDIAIDNTLVCYWWTGTYTPDADANTGMQLIPDPDADWVIDYIEARCMVTLGRIRRKFGGIANPEGSTDETDGQQLADEGTTKMQELLADLKLRQPPVPPLTE